MSWTIEQYEEWQATQNARESTFTTEDIPDIGKEAKLLRKIAKWARERGFPCWHDRSRGKNLAGWPDLTICLPGGIVLFIELKSAKGVLRSEQIQLKLQMDYLKQRYYVVKSFKRFLEIVLPLKGD